MALFWTEFICFEYANLDAAKRWWIASFECKQVPLPGWDDPLPSDIALKLPGFAAEPSILLRDRSEVGPPASAAPRRNQIIFCDRLEKAREHLGSRGVSVSSIEDARGGKFFHVSDSEGNLIEICKEP
jgi:hypothetical protein